MSRFTEDRIVAFRVTEDGDVELVAHAADDDCTITDRIDIGKDGSKRRLFILKELARRDGLRLVDARGKVVVR